MNSIATVLSFILFSCMYLMIGIVTAEEILEIKDLRIAGVVVIFWPIAFVIYLVYILVKIVLYIIKKEWK